MNNIILKIALCTAIISNIINIRPSFAMEKDLADYLDQEDQFLAKSMSQLNTTLNFDKSESDIKLCDIDKDITEIYNTLQQNSNTEIRLNLVAKIARKLPKIKTICKELKQKINKYNEPITNISNDIKNCESKIKELDNIIKENNDEKGEYTNKLNMLIDTFNKEYKPLQDKINDAQAYIKMYAKLLELHKQLKGFSNKDSLNANIKIK